jgi:SAM-dependent methyltransferase
MTDRTEDGSAGDANYSVIGDSYAAYRRPDPRIFAAIQAAFGDARTIVNVGAGAGSYEPVERDVTAVEPSAAMRAQRPAHLSSAIDATAERLPFDDDSFDAALASFTVHQWGDLPAGLREMRRVTRGPVVVLTCDPATLDRFWLADYAPEVIATEASRYPAIASIGAGLGGTIEVLPIPVPLDCTDGFSEAYYGRPEARSRGAAGELRMELRERRGLPALRRNAERRPRVRGVGCRARAASLRSLLRRIAPPGRLAPLTPSYTLPSYITW